MSRELKNKELVNTRLLKEYASWIYCENCNNTIGYLCYVTYDRIDFYYTCQCGSQGSCHLDFAELQKATPATDSLILKKNRLCCPQDEAPLLTILEDKLSQYTCEITCNCGQLYKKKKTSTLN